MRITGGTAKGRNIRVSRAFATQAGLHLRPTSAKVRQALFDIIAEKINGAVFGDMFAGSASVGIEAVSRGALEAICVEIDRFRANIIKETASKIGLQSQVRVFCADVGKFLQTTDVVFDILFFDPPYFDYNLDALLDKLNPQILAEDALVICEHHKKVKLQTHYLHLTLHKCYHYGDTMLSKFLHE